MGCNAAGPAPRPTRLGRGSTRGPNRQGDHSTGPSRHPWALASQAQEVRGFWAGRKETAGSSPCWGPSRGQGLKGRGCRRAGRGTSQGKSMRGCGLLPPRREGGETGKARGLLQAAQLEEEGRPHPTPPCWPEASQPPPQQQGPSLLRESLQLFPRGSPRPGSLGGVRGPPRHRVTREPPTLGACPAHCPCPHTTKTRPSAAGAGTSPRTS